MLSTTPLRFMQPHVNAVWNEMLWTVPHVNLEKAATLFHMTKSFIKCDSTVVPEIMTNRSRPTQEHNKQSTTFLQQPGTVRTIGRREEWSLHTFTMSVRFCNWVPIENILWPGAWALWLSACPATHARQPVLACSFPASALQKKWKYNPFPPLENCAFFYVLQNWLLFYIFPNFICKATVWWMQMIL